MKLILSLCLLFLVTAFATDGFADKRDERKALAAFNKGIKLYKKGKMEEAVNKFRQADALNPSWKIKFNIGQCEASLKRYGLAIEAFEQYLGGGGDDVPIERRDSVLKELDRLRRMVGTITVTGEPGVDIFVESIKRGNTSVPSSIKVTAGIEHEITFMKDGEKLGSVKLTVSGGEVIALPTDTQKPELVSVQDPADMVAVGTEPAGPVTIYPNMAELKKAYRSKIIDKRQYKENQKIIRANRQVEFDKLKADYRAGVMTKREYKVAIKEVKNKYEGR